LALPNFFTPRVPLATLWPAGTPDKASYYDTAPLKATLERLVDFDRINAGSMRFSVGAVNVGTGNFAYFDTTTHRIRPEHVMASGSLPPGFPATEVDGEYYWDGSGSDRRGSNFRCLQRRVRIGSMESFDVTIDPTE
jgi:NTE family protein